MSNILKKFGEWVTPQKKHCYLFNEGSWDDRQLLGNKGADLCELHRLKLPVPLGFILTTEVCQEFFDDGKKKKDSERKAVISLPPAPIKKLFSPGADAVAAGGTESLDSKKAGTEPLDSKKSMDVDTGVEDDKSKAQSRAMKEIISKEPRDSDTLSQRIVDEYTRAVNEIEKQTGRQFIVAGKSGATKLQTSTSQSATPEPFPLLFSVRSSCPISCGGLADTILNIGMNDEVLATLIRLTANPRFAYDTYMRFLQQYGHTVMNVPSHEYENIINTKRIHFDLAASADFSITQMQEMINEFKALAQPPVCPMQQLKLAIIAIIKSWNSPSAKSYRELHNLTSDSGTGVIVQMMVFGNMNHRKSGSGICFTRHPSTGEKAFFGEFLTCAEGDDVIHATCAKLPITLEDMRKDSEISHVYDKLAQVETTLEKHYKDMLEIEFTVENGALYILEAHPGRRTPQAAVKVAVAMVHDKLLTEREALLRIDASKMSYFLHPIIDPALASTGLHGVEKLALGQGFAAAPGAAVGSLALNIDEAVKMIGEGIKVILALPDSSYDDESVLKAVEGVVVMNGSNTCPTATAARLLGKPAIVGVKSHCIPPSVSEAKICTRGMEILTAQLEAIDLASASIANKVPFTGPPISSSAAVTVASDGPFTGLKCSDGKTILRTKDMVTIDGSRGTVYQGALDTVEAGQDADFQTLLRWAEKYKRMDVYGVGESSNESYKSVIYGADGNFVNATNLFLHSTRGLRHEKKDLMAGLLIANSDDERRKILDKMFLLHRDDYVYIFRQCTDRSVKITLLDPKVADFLPKGHTMYKSAFDADIREIATKMEVIDLQQSLHNAERLVKGAECKTTGSGLSYVEKGDVRLYQLYPHVTEMQVKAILGASRIVYAEGINVLPELLFPQVFTERELDSLKPVITITADKVFQDSGITLPYSIGCVLDTPRACMRSDLLGDRGLDSVLLDLNALTNHVYGTTRADMAKFLPHYLKTHIIAKDPYETIDKFGVGTYIDIAIDKLDKRVRVGAVGSQVCDADSMELLDVKNVDYVVCRPQDVPVAKIVAAQAHIRALASKCVQV